MAQILRLSKTKTIDIFVFYIPVFWGALGEEHKKSQSVANEAHDHQAENVIGFDLDDFSEQA